MSEIKRILVLDDDATFRPLLAKALRAKSFAVEEAASLVEARDLADAVSHAIVDLRLGAEDGLEIIPHLLAHGCQDIIVLTGYGSIQTALDAMRLGAKNFLLKPTPTIAIIEALAGPPLVRVQSVESVPTLTDVKWEHVQRVLRDCGGNVTRAAKVLGMKRQSLQRRLRLGRS